MVVNNLEYVPKTAIYVYKTEKDRYRPSKWFDLVQNLQNLFESGILALMYYISSLSVYICRVNQF